MNLKQTAILEVSIEAEDFDEAPYLI